MSTPGKKPRALRECPREAAVVRLTAFRSEGVAKFRETRPAKTTDTARIATSTEISRRRESMTSAKAPEGRGNRNNGRLTATCTRDTVIGLASTLVINQPDGVSAIE